MLYKAKHSASNVDALEVLFHAVGNESRRKQLKLFSYAAPLPFPSYLSFV